MWCLTLFDGDAVLDGVRWVKENLIVFLESAEDFGLFAIGVSGLDCDGFGLAVVVNEGFPFAAFTEKGT